MSPIFLVEILVLTILAVLALAIAGTMAFRPSQRSYELLRPVSWGLVFGTLAVTGTGLTNMLTMLGRRPWSVELGQTACLGLAELIVPSALAYAVLTVAWGLAAVGLRRLE